MPRKHTILSFLFITSPLFMGASPAQTSVNFLVDPTQSSFVLTMSSNVTFFTSTFSDTGSDTAAVTGTVQADMTPSSSPFAQIQLTQMTLSLDENVKLRNQVGSLGAFEVDVQRDSLSLVLVNPGSTAVVTAGAFSQSGNEMSIIGVYQLTGEGLIAAASATLNDLVNSEFGNFMLSDVSLSGTIAQENMTLRLEMPINVTAQTDFNQSGFMGDVAFSVVGTAVATAEITGVEWAIDVPNTFELRPNYPNPFNPSTTLTYDLPMASDVSMIIFDLKGSEVRTLVDAVRPPGRGSVVWDGRDNGSLSVASGVYVVRMLAGDFSAFQKLMLLR